MKPERHTAKAGKAKPAAFVFVTVLGLWLLWSGHFSFSHPILFAFGIASAAFVTLLCARMGLLDSEITPLGWIWRGIIYSPWLGREVVKSAWAVLVLGILRHRPIEPARVELSPDLDTDLGLVLYANSITLTPGTLALDSDARERSITVHAISEATARDLLAGDMERRVRILEGHPR